MKKHALTIILFLVSFSLFFVSCKKEKDTPGNNNQAFASVMPQSDYIASLIEFRNKIDAGNLKTGETITISEAVGLMEGTLNLEYGSASYAFENAYRTSFDVEVELNNSGTIDVTEAISKYDDALDQIKSFYGTISASQKQLIGVDAILKETLAQKIIVTFKPSVGTPPIGVMNFGSTDYWEWGFGNGKCGGYENPVYMGRDAATEIEKKVLARKGVPTGGYVYIDFWSPTFDILADQYLNPNDLTPGDNIRDYLMYGNWDNLPNFNTCISPSDMNFYLTGTESVINQNKPTGKVLFDVEVIGDIALTSPDFYHHRMMPVYASLYYTGQDPKELD